MDKAADILFHRIPLSTLKWFYALYHSPQSISALTPLILLPLFSKALCFLHSFYNPSQKYLLADLPFEKR
jgi:hypothetical protein